MSERYTRLFALSENLYAEGSPTVISAGALLKDNQTGKVLVQLKIKNIGASVIKAAKVTVQPLDTVGARLGDEVGYTYLDLSVNRDDEFGQKTLIPLPDKESRGFEVRLTEAIFADNTLWKENGGVWESLPQPESIDTIGDYELVKQYRIKFGANSSIRPMEIKDLWYCACGAINHQGEICYKCNNSLSAFQAMKIEHLEAEKEKRLNQEKLNDAARRAEEKKKQKKRTIMTAIAVAVIAAAIAISIPIKRAAKAKLFAINEQNYAEAFSLIESGKYQEGQDLLSSYFMTENALVTHSEKISDCYEKAQNYYDNYDFYEADAVLSAIRGFYGSFPKFYEESTKSPLSFSESEHRIVDEYRSLRMDTRKYVDVLDLAASILPDDDYKRLIDKSDGFKDLLNYCLAMFLYSEEDGTDVTEVYQLLQSAKDYSLAASFLKTNPYMQIIAQLEGVWTCPSRMNGTTMTFSNGVCHEHYNFGGGSDYEWNLYIHGDNLSTLSWWTAIMPLYGDLIFTDENTFLYDYDKTDYGTSYDTFVKKK